MVHVLSQNPAETVTEDEGIAITENLPGRPTKGLLEGPDLGGVRFELRWNVKGDERNAGSDQVDDQLSDSKGYRLRVSNVRTFRCDYLGFAPNKLKRR